jgi:sugar phosphate isomerase/epimerase
VAGQIGLQLYTVRDACAADLRGTLGRVAEIGFRGVELHDLYGHTPEEMRALLDGAGLVAIGRHLGLDADLEAIAAEARTLGYDRVALAWTDPAGSLDEGRATVARVADAAARADALGLRYGYHNHWHELEAHEDGTTVLDLLAELPVWLELDLGWVWWAGEDPVALLERFRGRTPLVHVKDLRARGTREYCAVGDGGVGYDRVVPAADAEWLVVEQDEHDGDPLEAVERSYAAVASYLGVAA